MSDLDTILAMLELRKIDYEKDTEYENTITITTYGGYSGFFTLITFKLTGELLKIEAFE